MRPASQDRTFVHASNEQISDQIYRTRKALDLTALYGCAPGKRIAYPASPFGADGNISLTSSKTALGAHIPHKYVWGRGGGAQLIHYHIKFQTTLAGMTTIPPSLTSASSNILRPHLDLKANGSLPISGGPPGHRRFHISRLLSREV